MAAMDLNTSSVMIWILFNGNGDCDGDGEHVSLKSITLELSAVGICCDLNTTLFVFVGIITETRDTALER